MRRKGGYIAEIGPLLEVIVTCDSQPASLGPCDTWVALHTGKISKDRMQNVILIFSLDTETVGIFLPWDLFATLATTYGDS